MNKTASVPFAPSAAKSSVTVSTLREAATLLREVVEGLEDLALCIETENLPETLNVSRLQVERLATIALARQAYTAHGYIIGTLPSERGTGPLAGHQAAAPCTTCGGPGHIDGHACPLCGPPCLCGESLGSESPDTAEAATA